MGRETRPQGRLIWLVLLCMWASTAGSRAARAGSGRIGLAVEFNTHAACAYVARDKGWFREKGLHLASYETYKTGLALAAALARGDIQAAYICLAPALLCRGRGIPIKAVLGTHLYGYGLVVQQGIFSVDELGGRTIGCVREGSPADLLLHLMIERYHPESLKVRRMGPLQLLTAMKTRRLDGAWLPEHYMTMARVAGLSVLLKSQDLWPGMQGSVLVVKEQLISQRPGAVRALAEVTRDSTAWLNRHPRQGAAIMGCVLKIPPEVALESMGNLDYRAGIDPRAVQDAVDLMFRLGYLEKRIDPGLFLYRVESAEDIQ
ncbi:MAG: ABC transporter substrate-binding protein [Deltaproteobacteria bacterium]|nr:ABC transporter substrate-binding protein [Deltaproteobacteria bacterium]